MLKRLGERVVGFFSFLFALIAGILLAVGVTVWHLIPKWKREEQEATDRKVEALKDTLRQAHAERAAKVDQAVAVVKEEAEAQKAGDSVDIANQFIIDAMKKEG